MEDQYGIPGRLLEAVIHVESGGNRWAIRHEPGYPWLHEVERYALGPPSRATEKMAQETSWGLMQVMGATARWMGFEGRYLSELCVAEVGLEWGCEYLRWQYNRYGRWGHAVAAYQAGTVEFEAPGRFKNQWYVNRVFERIENQWRGD